MVTDHELRDRKRVSAVQAQRRKAYSTMNAIVEKRTNEYKMGPLASCVARSVSSITASTFVEHRLPLMKKKRPLYRQSPPFHTD